MALRPGSGAGGGGAGSGGSYMFPVNAGIGPPQGMIPMQQQSQGFPMVSMMQPNMQNMMGIGYGSQIPQAAMAMQGTMTMGPMQGSTMSFMGQPSFMAMHPSAQQYTPDMQKQLAEGQQKIFEQQQKMLEEQRKRRQFEEQKQKLRMLSSVKPKFGEKSRDDALEAIKGNLDGFSRDAKMHPTPLLHTKKTDFSTPSHSAVSVPQSSALGADEEFSDFMTGPVAFPFSGAPAPSIPFQPFSSSVLVGQSASEQAITVSQSPSLKLQGSASSHGNAENHTSHSSSAANFSSKKTGLTLDEKMLTSCDFSSPGKSGSKSKTPEDLANVGLHAPNMTNSYLTPGLFSNNCGIVVANVSGGVSGDGRKGSENKESGEESVNVGMFSPPEPIQPMLPSWIFNDSMVPELYKTVLEVTMTTVGIDTTKLYPILMSSGLPRETLGQIWASANRTTPGTLTKEELYTVLAMIAIAQRGGPAVSTDVLVQISSPPIPTFSGFPMSMPTALNQLHILQSVPALSRPVNASQPFVTVNNSAPPAGSAMTQMANTFVMPSFSTQQAVKTEDDDFQDFQDASKSGPIDDSFSDFQSDTTTKTTTSQIRNSAPTLLMPMPGTVTPPVSSSADKYAVFKAIDVEKPAESRNTFSEFGDKYDAFRELEKPPENKSLGDGFADFKSPGADDGFTDFKTADSVSPLDPPAKETMFPSPFPTLPHQQKPPAPIKPSLLVSDLDPLSSVATSTDCGTFSFAATFPSSKPTGFPAIPHSSSSTIPSTITSKNSTVPDDFEDFNVFGASTKVPSTCSQDDFADFMAFNSNAGSTEQNTEDKHKAVKQEASEAIPPLPITQMGQTSQPTLSASLKKYEIFKQLSLENSSLVYDGYKDVTPSSLKNDDDFADFQTDKFTMAECISEKSFVDKIAAFKQAKEDSASVKSLDLPSIGGSSVGKEDSEDALSIQFDMKLADVGGDLKHVMSDSSLDLPTVSGQHPPAADVDDFKDTNDNNGSALSSLANYDWTEKNEVVNQNKKQSDFFLSTDCGLRSSTSIFQKKETSFGSSENITLTTISKVTTFSSDDYVQENSIQNDTSTKLPAEEQTSSLFKTAIEDVSGFGQDTDGLEQSPSHISGEQRNTDDFGEFQREKPKISKFDFLMANSQGKLKSSEEMIRSELATLDLCVQGSHKRSLSLGDKEISRSSVSPAPEQPFRDRSNTLSEKPALPVIRDKYKDLTGEVEESERYAYEWQRCLESALQVIKKANDTLNGISSSSVCTEVIQSAQGMEYLLGVVEVYRVTKRVELGIKATAVCSEKLQLLLKEIDKLWNNLIGFMSLAALTPDESALDFSSCMLRPGIKNAQELACGVCLLNVDSRSKAFNSETDNFKLSYGGHQYHASCANFWINCVEPKPPGLFLPDLL
ncbi:synergin gamma isoform X2 [Bombina bombina]|uniref:synergin gamma isoform X2 n=1 Tax=Bombina bombina TaxID=8345 RepID=UPI00235A5C05|nr:synergin gamma isoform X2 [Bombina bombina]